MIPEMKQIPQKENLLVSVSGGETSMYMAQWLWYNKQDEYNMVFVFANTGQERRETTLFIRMCEDHFGFKVHYIEAVVYMGERKSTGYKEVKYQDLDFDGGPFEWVIKKYGIPNKAFPHCTRELKTNPIRSFGREYFKGEPYHTAIGIRSDEIDRMSRFRVKERIIYPLISDRPMTKKKINFWWTQHPFRLHLKGYQGNCITCWKKSDLKLAKIYQESPSVFMFMYVMERRYEYDYGKRPVKIDELGRELPIRFFRENKSVEDIADLARQRPNINLTDENDQYDTQCEIFAECGIDN